MGESVIWNLLIWNPPAAAEPRNLARLAAPPLRPRSGRGGFSEKKRELEGAAKKLQARDYKRRESRKTVNPKRLFETIKAWFSDFGGGKEMAACLRPFPKKSS